ncbi:MAG: preprotein translocase subunit YajC [Myxococcota bacterium]|nr:preprotein translocase subunit YajC [Myxococcota bacterium]
MAGFIMFASTAPAPTQAPGFFTGGIIPMLLIFAVFYFMILYPQSKQRRQHEAFLKGIKKGDQVLTQSGIIGKIHSVKENEVTLDLGRDHKVRFLARTLAGPYTAAKAEQKEEK